MLYREVLPPPLLTQHVECFWQLSISPKASNHRYEVMAPDCTFDIIFSSHPLLLGFSDQKLSAKMNAGGAFVGQKTSSVRFLVRQPQEITGIRFKPFAFAQQFPVNPRTLINRTLPLEQLFELKPSARTIIHQILRPGDFARKVHLCEDLVLQILREDLRIDQLFRAQLNYILDRKGQVEIQQLFAEFGISKVTLRKHFIEKMGLSPKVVSRIWRLNHFLELEKRFRNNNLTKLALDSGYYDQAHFIREFKSFFHDSPRQFFRQESHLLSISQDIISKRFSNRYDPVFTAD